MDSSSPSPDPFHGLNPADLMAAAAMPTDGGADTLPLTPRDLPSLAEIAAAFPDLEILDLIGHGGMSAVFRARQPRLDRMVALKVLPKSLAATPGFAERFTREGRVLARLSHPNIVTVHDFGESGGFCFLIMEYVDGVNLRQAMRAGRFTPEQALGIIPVMCEALQYAHSQGVLHRDIKPENILLDAKGRVKIADFGIAKILNEDGDGGMMLTQSGARLGTAPYMAPEQIEKPGSVDHRADIYSLGVVFYEMLTGELPLGRFAAPSEKSAVNGSMDEVVFRALAKERERRQQSAGEFKTQVESATMAPASHPGRQSSETQMRALKLGGAVAGSVFVGANVIFLRHFFQAPQPDWPRTVLPWVLLNAGGLSLILNLLLWLRLVPVNRIYGVQSPATLSSPKRWYEVNAFFGKQAFWWSFVVFGAGIAGFYQLPRHQDAYAWATLTLTLVGIAASVVSTLVWIRRHPVGGPEIRPHRLVRNLELVFPALVLAFFIKAFICASYSIPHGHEPGVAKGSHWMASRLNTGFAPGDLVAYAHESGQTWLARVVAVDLKGLRLKRGSSAEEFFMAWDKIIGKMLFPYYSPGKLKGAGLTPAAPRASPVIEGTASALQHKPVLMFTRLKQNRKEWQWPVYTPQGNPAPAEESEPLIARSTDGGAENQNDETCWLQLWFGHPDFDHYSVLKVDITDVNGQPLPDRDADIAGPFWSSDKPTPVLKSLVISPGRRGKLPEKVRIVLHYSMGPWKYVSKVPTDFNGSMSLGDGCLLAALGEDHDQRAFLAWSKFEDETSYDGVALLKNRTSLGSVGKSSSGTRNSVTERIYFPTPLREVECFRIRSRKVQMVTFDSVVIPPLP
ncbi:protein kinase domain-containing protein [Prosthecobacter sp.]|uniref:serine/threonine-protein kinase n=1 Tax=Prosthecobacter sp. TaxID=1965333 RepID=UPI0037838D68